MSATPETVVAPAPAVEPQPAPAPEPKPSLLNAAPAPEPEKPISENPEPQSAVPEKYEFKLPDGMALDEGVTSDFTTIAKELKLSQEQAQKLMDLGVRNLTVQQQRMAESWHKECDRMQEEIKADKEFGGVNLTDTIRRAQRTIEKFGSPQLLDFLDKTRLGDSPELLKFFARVDKALGEDKAVEGSPAPSDKNLAKLLYPNM